MTRREAILSLAGAAVVSPLEFLVLETASKRAIKVRWEDTDRPIPAGSLVKPFLALAYGETHGQQFPTLTCTRCWKPDGHGRLSLPEAIAVSCNSYFLKLAADCDPTVLANIAAIYGIPAPSETSPEAFAGLRSGWRIPACALANAYAELALRRTDPGPALVLSGMRLSAQHGTGRGIQAKGYAKTGTGPCVHPTRGSGDGYAAVLYPLDSPSRTILARLHNRPGASAASAVLPMLRTLT